VARTKSLEAFVSAALKPPGLCPIKQVELYNKFRPFFRRQYWEETCPRLRNEVMARIKDASDKNSKSKLPNMAASRTTAKRAATEATRARSSAPKRAAATAT
jgi:hypothetical protein